MAVRNTRNNRFRNVAAYYHPHAYGIVRRHRASPRRSRFARYGHSFRARYARYAPGLAAAGLAAWKFAKPRTLPQLIRQLRLIRSFAPSWAQPKAAIQNRPKRHSKAVSNINPHKGFGTNKRPPKRKQRPHF